MSSISLHEQFDWLSAEIKKARADLNVKRQAFFDADAKVSQLERDRGIIWGHIATALSPAVRGEP